jgi:putative membrane protein
MKKLLYLGAVTLFLISATACNDNRKAKNYNEKTLVDDMALSFMKKANEAGLAEIKAATVAKSKSQNPKVIGFADMMIADHTMANKELNQIADKKYVAHEDEVISQEHQMMIDSISKLNGPQFDKAYMNMMVNDHTKAVALFSDMTRNTSKTINNYVAKYLPKMQEHLNSARSINASL